MFIGLVFITLAFISLPILKNKKGLAWRKAK